MLSNMGQLPSVSSSSARKAFHGAVNLASITLILVLGPAAILAKATPWCLSLWLESRPLVAPRDLLRAV